MSIYVYRKTHNITGLMYVGKFQPRKGLTVESYEGSGLHWKRHLKKHGKDITTEVLGVFEDQEEATEFALFISEELDIVNSVNYANLKPENARDGGSDPCVYTPEAREKMRQAKLKTIAEKGTDWLSRPHTEEAKAKMSAKAKERVARGYMPPNAGKMAGWNKGLKTGPQKKHKCESCGKMVASTWIKRHKENNCYA